MEKKSNFLIPSISVDGNIAAGKTTFLEKLETELKFPTYYETVHQWKFLKKFYKNPKEYALLLQLEILFSYAPAHAAPIIHLMERSSSAGFLVFAQMLQENGHLNQVDYAILERIWKEYNKHPTLIIYLDVPPVECHKRLLKRNRPGEQEIPLAYLHALDAQYKKYLHQMKSICEVHILEQNEYTLDKSLDIIHTHWETFPD